MWNKGIPPKDGEKYLVRIKIDPENNVVVVHWKDDKGIINWYSGFRYYSDNDIAYWAEIPKLEIESKVE